MTAETLTNFGEMADIIAPLKFVKKWHLELFPSFITYSPGLTFQIDTKNYTLKTADTYSELMQVFELRYNMFLAEHGGEGSDIDVDEFDKICDHIIIKNKEDDSVIGTYRILSSEKTDRFYSQNEFNLDVFLKEDGIKLELGRACISKEFQNGHVLNLLWKGIGHYLKETGAKYLFGCSSVHNESPQVGYGLMGYLQKQNWHSEEFKISTEESFFLKKPASISLDEESAKGFLPSLLRSYLTAGAKVYSTPAWDKDFHCMDFFTILCVDDMTSSYRRRYLD